MPYSKKVIDKFEKTLREPEKNNVGRWDPTDADIGTGMVGAPAFLLLCFASLCFV